MMERYNSYRDSGVEWIGEIPNQWKILKNKYFTIPRKEKSETGEEELLSVSEYHGVIPRRKIRDNDEHISRSESLEGYLKVYNGDLVSNIMLMWKRGLGVTEFDGIVSPAYSVFSFVNSVPKYFHYLLRTDQYVSEFKRNSTGVIESRLRLYDDSFGSLSSHFPPLPEQQQIVTFLDTKTSLIDSLIEKTQRKIELLKDSIPNYHFYSNEKIQFVEMKEYWFQKKPSDWGILKLREIFDVVSEKNHPDERLLSVHQIKGVIYRDEQLQDVMNPSGDISNYKLVKPGDFIISLRSSEGGFEYSEVTGLVSPVYTVLRPKFKIDTIFYKYLFKTHNFIVELNRFIKGIRDGKNINFVDIRDVSVPVPLVFNLKVHQNHLNILKSFLIEEKRIELLKEYRHSLISEVVTGKRKVVD